MVILQSIFFIPQIVHNARSGHRAFFDPFYILGYLGARILMPLYDRGCPDNHFVLTPMIGLVIAVLLLYSFQILMLFLQFKLGPKFFIPRVLLPEYYNYNVKLKMSEENRELECAICLLNIFDEHLERS